MKKIYLFIIAVMAFTTLTQAQTPGWQWAIGAGGAADEVGNDIVTDASGNSYSVGQFSSASITFGSTTLTKVGGGNIYVVKHDPSGNVIWAKSFGGFGAIGKAICLDPSGNIYIAGMYMYNMTFGSTTLTSVDTTTNVGDIYITKLDSSGNVLWAKSAGGHVGDGAYSIAADASGNVYITGYFKSHTIDFGSISLTSPNNNASTFFIYTDFFIAKYDSSGNPVWAKIAGGPGLEDGSSICVDAAGDILVAGNFYMPSITFGSITLTATAAYNMFVVKYDSSGNAVWAQTGAASGSGSINHSAKGVATDASNNVYVTGGYMASTLTFGSVSLTNSGGNDMYVLKLNSSGTAVWANHASADNAYGTSIAVDGSGNPIVGGYYEGLRADFITDTVTNANVSGYNTDSYLAKYDATGNLVWLNGMGGIYFDEINGVAADASGNGFATGRFTSTTTAFGGIIVNIGGIGYSDAFIAKVGTATGIEENEQAVNFKAYPNPTNGIIQLQLEQTQEVTVTVLNYLGASIYAEQINASTTIDLSNQSKGVYFVNLRLADGTNSTKKIIVQ